MSKQKHLVIDHEEFSACYEKYLKKIREKLGEAYDSAGYMPNAIQDSLDELCWNYNSNFVCQIQIAGKQFYVFSEKEQP